MITLAAATGNALVELGPAVTPGPNMFYLVSRSISQGWRAGLMSLAGTAAGFVVPRDSFGKLFRMGLVTNLLPAVPN